MEWIKINCECGRIKRLIFKDQILTKIEEREVMIEIIESGSHWSNGKIPSITEFCRGYCYKLGSPIPINKIGTNKYENF